MFTPNQNAVGFPQGLGVPAQGVNPLEAQGAPATPAVQQVAPPTGFNIFQHAVAKVKAESSSARKPAWECTAVELRAYVTFKDVQAVSKRNPAEYHMRAFLSPRPIPMERILGNDAAGNPINTIVVPAQYKDAAEAQFREQVVNAGHLDAILLEVAQEIKKAKDEKANAPKKAPVNTAAADQAMADLAALSQSGAPQFAQGAAPIPNATPTYEAPVHAQGGIPGLSGIPNFG